MLSICWLQLSWVLLVLVLFYLRLLLECQFCVLQWIFRCYVYLVASSSLEIVVSELPMEFLILAWWRSLRQRFYVFLFLRSIFYRRYNIHFYMLITLTLLFFQSCNILSTPRYFVVTVSCQEDFRCPQYHPGFHLCQSFLSLQEPLE